MAEVIDVVDDFVLSLDSLIRVVPFSLWNTNVLSKREAVWNELNSVLKK